MGERKSAFLKQVRITRATLGVTKMLNYLWITLAALLIAVNSASAKRYSAVVGSSLVSGLTFNVLIGAVSSLFFWGLCGFRLSFSWFSFVFAMATALFAGLYLVLGFRVMEAGGITIYSLFLMSGGMVLPYLFGLLFLDEPLTLPRVFGILLILVALWIANRSKVKLKPSFYALCIVIFLLNGCVSILSKCHQINTVYPMVSSAEFSVYQNIGRVVISLVLLAFVRKPNERLSLPPLKHGWTVVLSGLASGTSFLLQLNAAVHLPASVLFPFITGGSVIFASLIGAVFFKEKLTAPRLAAIGLCFAGTLFFL